MAAETDTLDSSTVTPPPASTSPVPTHEFAEFFSRNACAGCLAASNEPARVAEHNRLASRILTPKGMTGMQQINPVDMMIAMLSRIAAGQAAILNELLLARTGKAELRGNIQHQPHPDDNGNLPHPSKMDSA
jgi:hypothetical protein